MVQSSQESPQILPTGSTSCPPYPRAKTVISNATRWDTFENMLGDDRLPEGEKLFRERYKKAPSFFSMHLGVKADVLPK